MQVTFVSPGFIAAALQVPHGVTAIVGGGGKTTIMQSLAEELAERARVLITTTTHIWVPDWAPVLLNPTVAEVERAFSDHPARPVCVGAPAPSGKLCACEMPMEKLAHLADYVLVESDGAKRLPLKAPAPHEPVIPKEARLVLAVAGLDGVGQTISKTAFRPERYAALLHTTEDHIITPRDAAIILCHENGLRKAVEREMRFSIVLNKADDRERVQLATEIAAHIPQCLAELVICTSFKGEDQYVGTD